VRILRAIVKNISLLNGAIKNQYTENFAPHSPDCLGDGARSKNLLISCCLHFHRLMNGSKFSTEIYAFPMMATMMMWAALRRVSYERGANEF
jgi:hypothetical protein